MTWREWFEKSLAQYPTPWKYLFESQEYMKPVMQAAKRWCPPPANVLEAGCGIGMTAMSFAAEGYGVHGVDHDRQVLHLAAGLPWFKNLHAAICSHDRAVILFEQEIRRTQVVGYELAFSGGVIEHVDMPERRELLQELKRQAPVQIVVIPSPLQMATSTDPDDMDWQPIPMSDLIQLCCHAGWNVVESFGFGDPGPKVVNIGNYEPWMSLCVVGRSANAA